MENKKQYLHVILSYTELTGKRKVILVKEDAVFFGALEWLKKCFSLMDSNWLMRTQFSQLFFKINNFENLINFKKQGRMIVSGPWQGKNFGGMLLSGRFIFPGIRFWDHEKLEEVISRIIVKLLKKKGKEEDISRVVKDLCFNQIYNNTTPCGAKIFYAADLDLLVPELRQNFLSTIKAYSISVENLIPCFGMIDQESNSEQIINFCQIFYNELSLKFGTKFSDKNEVARVVDKFVDDLLNYQNSHPLIVMEEAAGAYLEFLEDVSKITPAFRCDLSFCQASLEDTNAGVISCTSLVQPQLKCCALHTCSEDKYTKNTPVISSSPMNPTDNHVKPYQLFTYGFFSPYCDEKAREQKNQRGLSYQNDNVPLRPK